MNNLNDETFNEFVSEGLICVDFHATWCQPCKTLGPIIEKMASERTDVKFAKVDIDDAPNTASSLRIQSIPTLVFFKDGVEVDRIVGLLPASKIASRIDGLTK